MSTLLQHAGIKTDLPLLVTSCLYGFDICEQTDKQTYIYIYRETLFSETILHTPPRNTRTHQEMR